jgi:hypothetical protein
MKSEKSIRSKQNCGLCYGHDGRMAMGVGVQVPTSIDRKCKNALLSEKYL